MQLVLCVSGQKSRGALPDARTARPGHRRAVFAHSTSARLAREALAMTARVGESLRTHAAREHARPTRSAVIMRAEFSDSTFAVAIDCDAFGSASSSTGFFARVQLREKYGCAGKRLEGK